MKVHELKIWRKYFNEIIYGWKNFEVRKNDRNFQVGDILHLKETYDDTDKYTGFELLVEVKYIHKGLGIQDGYVCMAFMKVEIKQAD